MKNLNNHKKRWQDFFLGSIPSSESLELTICPICKSNQFSKLYSEYYPRLVKCLKCHLIYTNPRMKKKFIKKLYSSHYFKNNQSSIVGYQNYVADEEKIRKTFRRRILNINKVIKQGNLLDIGSAMGYFVDEAQRSGWQAEGLEISKHAVLYARGSLGLNIYQGDIEDTKLNINSYDLVTMWDVIEHLSNPKEVLLKIRKSLKKNGLLVFSTPNVDSVPAKISGPRWIGYKLSDEHLFYFSPETLKLLCEKTGFKIIKTQSIGKYVSFSLFTQRLGDYSIILGKIFSLINHLIPKSIKFYLNPLDIICVYAKKI